MPPLDEYHSFPVDLEFTSAHLIVVAISLLVACFFCPWRSVILKFLGYFVGLALAEAGCAVLWTLGHLWCGMDSQDLAPYYLLMGVIYTAGFLPLALLSQLAGWRLQKRINSLGARTLATFGLGIGVTVIWAALSPGTYRVALSLVPDYRRLAWSECGHGQSSQDILTPIAEPRLVKHLTHEKINYWWGTPEFSADGRLLGAVGCRQTNRQCVIVVWDTATWAASELPLESRSDAIRFSDLQWYLIRFSPEAEGKWLAAGGTHGFRVWNLQTRQQALDVTSANWIDGLGEEILGLYFSPDGKLLVSQQFNADYQDTLTLWDTASGKRVGGLILPDGFAANVALRPEGLAVMRTPLDSNDLELTFWNLATREAVGPPLMLTGEQRGLSSGAWFTPDGQHLFEHNVTGLDSSGSRGSLLVWDLGAQPPTSQVIAELEGIDRIAFNPSRTLFAWTTSAVSGITVLDVNAERRFTVNLAGRDHKFSFSADGGLLAASSDAGGGPAMGIYIFDVGNP